MKKKYTLEEFKELFDVASEAIKSDIENLIKESKEDAKKMGFYDETVSAMLNVTIKNEQRYIIKKLNEYMFSSLEKK